MLRAMLKIQPLEVSGCAAPDGGKLGCDSQRQLIQNSVPSTSLQHQSEYDFESDHNLVFLRLGPPTTRGFIKGHANMPTLKNKTMTPLKM